MRKYKSIILIVITLLFIITTACYKDNNIIAEENSIKIYRTKTDKFLREAIFIYKVNYPNIEVEEVVFDDIYSYKQNLVTDILSGTGPDIIFFNKFYIQNIYKTIESGAFEDIEPLIKNDNEIDLSELNLKVLQSGVFDNKRFFIPLDYSLDLFWTTEETLKENGIDIEKSNLNQNSFINQLKEFYSKSKNKSEEYLFSHYFGLSDFLLSSGINFIDYKNKEVLFDSSEFIEIINNYKYIYNLFCPIEVREKYSNQEYDMIKNRKLLFLNGKSLSKPKGIAFTSSFITSLSEQTPIVYSMPAFYGDNKVIAKVENCLAINSNSTNKELAYNFIKIALSETMQLNNYLNYIPVNNNVVESELKKYSNINPQEITYNGIPVILNPIPDYINTSFSNYIENIEYSTFIDSSIEFIMMEALIPYFEDEISIDKAISKMKQKILLYLNE